MSNRDSDTIGSTRFRSLNEMSGHGLRLCPELLYRTYCTEYDLKSMNAVAQFELKTKQDQEQRRKSNKSIFRYCDEFILGTGSSQGI